MNLGEKNMDYKVVQMDEHTWRIEEFDDTSSVYMYLLEGSERAMLLDSGLGICVNVCM